MGRTLAQIFKDADAIIEKRAGVSAQEVSEVVDTSSDDDIFKLAEAVKHSRTKEEKVASIKFSETEKVAYSKAILDTVFNIGDLSKLASFEKRALDMGVSQDKVDELIKKATVECRIDAVLEKFKK